MLTACLPDRHAQYRIQRVLLRANLLLVRLYSIIREKTASLYEITHKNFI